MAEINTNSLFLFPDDGLPSTAAESWVKQKVAVVRQYLTAFVAHLAGQVDDIIFVDLYAGNGMYSIGARKDLFASSALMSLSLDLPVAKYVFCEQDPERLSTLKIRVNKYFRNRNVILLEGRPENLIDRINLYVPPSKGAYKSAVLCLVDPFSLETPFEVIRKLGESDFSFLVPFTFAINERLNYEFYLVEQQERVKRFLGSESLDRIDKDMDSNTQFYKKLIRIYQNNMLALGFNGATSVHRLDSGLMEMPVYYTGFFSKQVSTKAIQSDVEVTHHVQFELFNP